MMANSILICLNFRALRLLNKETICSLALKRRSPANAIHGFREDFFKMKRDQSW